MRPKRWSVMSFLGDYPIENQPLWDKEYASKRLAITAARTQHQAMLGRSKDNENTYTIIFCDDDATEVHWIFYQGKTIGNSGGATKLADQLIGKKSNKLKL